MPNTGRKGDAAHANPKRRDVLPFAPTKKNCLSHIKQRCYIGGLGLVSRTGGLIGPGVRSGYGEVCASGAWCGMLEAHSATCSSASYASRNSHSLHTFSMWLPRANIASSVHAGLSCTSRLLLKYLLRAIERAARSVDPVRHASSRNWICSSRWWSMTRHCWPVDTFIGTGI